MAASDLGLEEELEPGPSNGNGMPSPKTPRESRGWSLPSIGKGSWPIKWEPPTGEEQLWRASSDDGLQIASDEEQLPSPPNLQTWKVEQREAQREGRWGCLWGSSPIPPYKEQGWGDLARHWGKLCLSETPVCFDAHLPGFRGCCLVNLGCLLIIFFYKNDKIIQNLLRLIMRLNYFKNEFGSFSLLIFKII